MKTPLNLLHQLINDEQYNTTSNNKNHQTNQGKKSKPIKKQSVKNIETAKLSKIRHYKPKTKSQFCRSPQDLSTEEPFSPIMQSQQNIQTNYHQGITQQQQEYHRQQSSGLIKLYKISSEQSSKFNQIESEISTNYDDDSQLIDESMRSVSSSSILIQSEEIEKSDEIRRQEQYTQSNNIMMSEFQSQTQLDLGQHMGYEKNNQFSSNDATSQHTSQSTLNNINNVNINSNSQNPQRVDCSTQMNEFQVKPIFFMPGVPSTEKILKGESIIFKDHYKEILIYYDIIPVSRSFIEGASIQQNGVFFEVKPTDLDSFWAQKSQEFPRLANFINRGNSN